jgi:hypothetical protein
LSQGVPAQGASGGATWAVNIAGPAYLGVDGTAYETECWVSGGAPGRLEIVKGAQDPVLYRTFREGDARIARPWADGVYDITFHFAEHERLSVGDRVLTCSSRVGR